MNAFKNNVICIGNVLGKCKYIVVHESKILDPFLNENRTEFKLKTNFSSSIK